MTERHLLLPAAAAATALCAGAASVVLDQPWFGLLAGAAGVFAGGTALAFGRRVSSAEAERDRLVRDSARLNAELDALSSTYTDALRERANSPREKAEQAFDPSTGLYDERYFAVLVQQQVAAARRSLRPISVVIFELDGLADAPDAERERALATMGDVIRQTFRESDTACRLGDTMIGAILEDTAETGAVWAAERVRGTLLATPDGDVLTVSAGVACYPSHALGAAELVQQSGRALEEARRQGTDRVEIAPDL